MPELEPEPMPELEPEPMPELEPELEPETMPEPSEVKDYDKLKKIPYYILNDKNKFFNWIYPTYEETTYKYIENTEKLKDIAFNEKQGQLFTKQFLVDSPYRGILLYHGLGTGKTCAGLITSENLIEKKHVLILTPASLRQTWIDELKFCGDPIYKNETELIYKNYTFINYNSTDIKKIYSDIKNKIYLDSKVSFKKSEGEILEGRVIEITKGVFKKNKYNPTHIKIIDNKNEIQEYSIIEAEVKMLDNTNPFDNKIIIFDEVHNFIVTIANIYKKMQRPTDIQQMKKDIYDDLRNAINCKIILLSGTPIVNNVYEISFLANILNGNNMIYKYEYIITENVNKLNLSKMEEELKKQINFINYVNIELNHTKLSLNFMINPDYFVNKNQYEIEKEEAGEDSEINNIKKKLNKLKKEIEIILPKKSIFKSLRKLHLDARVMPNNSEMFEKLFLEKEYNPEYRTYIYKSIKNINSIKSLLAGKISYLRGDLPTKTIVNTINVPMGKLQESQYIIARRIEIISSRRKKQNDDENLANLRSKSRQICNIFIPSIHKTEDLNENEDSFEEEEVEEEEEEGEQDDKIGRKSKKEKKIDPRNKNVNSFIEEKIHSIGDKEGNINDIILDNIREYSCKCEHMIRVILESTKKNKTYKNHFYPMGKVLIYSDFRELYSGGVSFIAKLLEIADFGYMNFNTILDNFITTLEAEEKIIYEGANWGGNEIKPEFIDFQNKLLDFLKTFNEQLYHNKTFYLWHTSDTQHMKINYLAKFVYNNIENLNGNLLRVMFITKSGSEGISFKAIRQVHILEPFWQQTRETQVIGRAVRYKSHDDLPENEKNVYIYKYLASFANKTGPIDKDLSGDNNLTTDEYITDVSEKKQSIINTFYELMKQVALDCPYNNETMTCFSYNNIDYWENVNSKPIIFNDGISAYNVDVLRKEAYLVKKNNQSFIVYNNNLYDYEKYNLHNTLIKIGEINKLGEELKFKITRDYSARETCFIESEINTGLNRTYMNELDYYTGNKNINDNDTLSFIIFDKMKGGSEFSDDGDNESNYDSTDYDFSDSEEGIEDIFEEDEELEIKNEININETNYKTGDFICLEDRLTNDKILIGVILKITNRYIDISDTRIPILKHKDNDKLILLYKIIEKKEFINNLGIEMLNIYVNFDNIYKIYEKYIKNPHINKLVNNIYSKLKQYPAPPQSDDTEIESSEFIENLIPELDDFILEKLTDISLHLSDLNNLSDISGVSSLVNSYMNSSKIQERYYKIIIEKYKNLIDSYYSLYNYYIIEKNTPDIRLKDKDVTENNKLIKTKNFIKIYKSRKTITLFTELIEVLFYTECSLINNKEDDEEEVISVNTSSIYKKLYNKLKKDISTKTLLNGTKYNSFISNIENEELSIDEEENIDELSLSETDSEESSEDYNHMCDNIENKIEKYKNSKNEEQLLKINIIEIIWCLQEYIKVRNYDTQEVEIKLFEDSIIKAYFKEKGKIFTKELENTKLNDTTGVKEGEIKKTKKDKKKKTKEVDTKEVDTKEEGEIKKTKKDKKKKTKEVGETKEVVGETKEVVGETKEVVGDTKEEEVGETKEVDTKEDEGGETKEDGETEDEGGETKEDGETKEEGGDTKEEEGGDIKKKSN